MFAVTVTFRISAGRMAEFLPLIVANARASRDTEAGCHRFDVATDPGRPDEVFLYELYTDRAAFDAHMQTDHFRSFDGAAGGMIAEKAIATYATVQ
ncbi:MAG: antibiotic biosynthesis monooxygenase [Rhodobacteraceae bacterium]|nr:antibiotic biosynthesis monooxygenase [Paracoccaceae bacterium]